MTDEGKDRPRRARATDDPSESGSDTVAAHARRGWYGEDDESTPVSASTPDEADSAAPKEKERSPTEADSDIQPDETLSDEPTTTTTTSDVTEDPAAGDWTSIPLPASAVPPPPMGRAPRPLTIATGEAPAGHSAFMRPESGDGDVHPLEPPETGPEPAIWPESDPPAAVEPSPDAEAAAVATALDPASQLSPPTVLLSAVHRAPAATWAPASKETGLGSRFLSWVWPATLRTSPRSAAAVLRGLMPLAGLLTALALVITVAVWQLGSARPAAAPTPPAPSTTPDLVQDSDLLGPSDALLIDPGLTWTPGPTQSTVTDASPVPLCYVSAPNQPTPAVTKLRLVTTDGARALHRVDGYESVAAAQEAFALRRAQLGGCANIPVYLSAAAAVTKLGDEAVAIQAVIQDPQPQWHTLVLVRTGQVVNIVDAGRTGQAFAFEGVVAATSAVVARECDRSGGQCAAGASITPAPPPPGGVAGWLTVSDLPRITPGVGRWTTTDPSVNLARVVGTSCENRPLAAVPGATKSQVRTYLLTEDTKAPREFGLDELLLNFPDAATATQFADTLTTNLSSCTSRMTTAQVPGTGGLAGTGAAGEPIAGTWFTIVQTTSPTTSVIYRVAVLAAAKRVVYLVATPGATFDFTEPAWSAVAVRAAQRATQLQ